MNALTDALGMQDIEMPATPQRMWRACRGTGLPALASNLASRSLANGRRKSRFEGRRTGLQLLAQAAFLRVAAGAPHPAASPASRCPASRSASVSGFMTAGGSADRAPASPQPFTPSGCCVTGSPSSRPLKAGTSSARRHASNRDTSRYELADPRRSGKLR